MRRLEWASWLPVLLFGGLGALRFHTLHNETFDLAFYARMAHGLARFDLYDPIVGAHVLGLHVSPVLLPLGLLGLLFGQVPVLLVAQTLSAGFAAQGLARIGTQRLGPWGALTGLVFALHPNVGHVLSYEFHPGTLALAPLVGTLLAIDRGDARTFQWAALGVVVCREDLAAITALTGLLAWRAPGSPGLRSAGRVVFVVSSVWLVLIVGLIAPRFAPASGGSLDVHFGHLGGSLGSALLAVFTQPEALVAHLAQPAKWLYLPRVLLPLLYLPLLALPRALPAVPVLGMLLLSQFETTTELRSHYLTPALPALVWAAVHGLGRIPQTHQRHVGVLVLGAALWSFGHGGMGPFAPAFSALPFRADARTEAGRAVLTAIRPDASVQAPDVLLAHLAERQTVHRAAPPERRAQFWVLDIAHRQRFAGQGTLQRTTEEPTVRDMLARPDRGVLLYRPPFVVLERGRDPRAALREFEDRSRTLEHASVSLTACLGITHASVHASGAVRLHLRATGACPADLALRVGTEPQPQRVELLFGGAVSPAHLRAGDRLVSDYAAVLPEGEADRAELFVGALRSSGARPEPTDPTSVAVPLVRAP